MTSPTSAGPSATPLPSGTRLLHWSVAAPLSAVTGVGSAVLGVLADLPLLGVAGAVVAAVPAVLAGRRVPRLHADRARARDRAEAAEQALAGAQSSLVRSERALAQANEALALADRALAARAGAQPAACGQAAEQRPAVDLVKAPRSPAPDSREPVREPVPVQQATPHLVHHAAVASTRVGGTAAAAGAEPDARVDTAELQRIWDLGEATPSRSGRGRRVRVGAEPDALPDRPRNLAGPRRRARHRG